MWKTGPPLDACVFAIWLTWDNASIPMFESYILEIFCEKTNQPVSNLLTIDYLNGKTVVYSKYRLSQKEN